MKIRVVLFIIILLTVSRTRTFAQDSVIVNKQQSTDTIPVTDTIPATDSIPVVPPVNMDTVLRITNLIPYITLHVDSTLIYKLDVNKDPGKYYWFLRNAPVGLRINRDQGLLTFKAEKSFFLSGRLKYDFPYKVSIGVQNLFDATEKVDTSFTLVFYSTEIIPARVKPTVSNVLYIDEGDSVTFRVQCEEGSFPIERISMTTNIPLTDYRPVAKCNDEFSWKIPFDFIKDGDTTKQRMLVLSFIGTNKFLTRDTAVVRVYVRPALNYPQRILEYERVTKDIRLYILQLKYSFKELDKKVRKTKNTRTGFDLMSGTTALGGTVFSTMTDPNAKSVGKILPSVGVALVPVKEAVSPVKSYEQNSASLVRTSIRRLEYTLTDNTLVGDRDPDILAKTKKLKDDLKQIQVQLIDIPTLDTGNLSEEELNKYFNNPKVNKKYKVTRN